MIRPEELAKQLRIGNYVKYIPDGVEFIVTEINCFNQNSINGLQPEDIEPVELTKEWLIKAGFEKLPHFTVLHSMIKKISRDRVIQINDAGTANMMMWIGCIGEDGKTYKDLICLHNWDYDKELHVHKLQNIFFDLGEELVFNN